MESQWMLSIHPITELTHSPHSSFPTELPKFLGMFQLCKVHSLTPIFLEPDISLAGHHLYPYLLRDPLTGSKLLADCSKGSLV
jgi:hypothetical protein